MASMSSAARVQGIEEAKGDRSHAKHVIVACWPGERRYAGTETDCHTVVYTPTTQRTTRIKHRERERSPTKTMRANVSK